MPRSRTTRSASAPAELFDVRGARVVVTGAASGLGFAMAEVMADAGARVTLADVDADGLERAAGRLDGDVQTAPVDVSDADAVERLFAEVVEAQGGVDVAFANAGISLEAGVADPAGGLANLDRDAWDKVLRVNLDGVLFTMREAARHMKERGGGRIVVTASTAGFGTDPLVGYSYSATKAAVIVIVRQAALELAKHGVHVNAIAPGPFKTNIGGGAPPIPPEAWSEIVAIGRMAEPDELKGVALLLASPASSFMTGAVIPVDGGQLLMSHGF
jgi:NAD(P)-dependent dehydrogenase (short-subunit alcohol dehydrogenase family)